MSRCLFCSCNCGTCLPAWWFSQRNTYAIHDHALMLCAACCFDAACLYIQSCMNVTCMQQPRVRHACVHEAAAQAPAARVRQRHTRSIHVGALAHFYYNTACTSLAVPWSMSPRGDGAMRMARIKAVIGDVRAHSDISS